MSERKHKLEQGNIEFALRRLVSTVQANTEVVATATATAVGVGIQNSADEGLAEHIAARQFVHGVGALFVAKTKNASQLVDWTEIQNKPDWGDLDFADIEIDARQVVSGVFNLLRLPVADLGASVANKLVRSNDPRLMVTQTVYPAGEPLGGGDFLRVGDASGVSKVFRADATAADRKAVGFTPESHGPDDMVTVFPYGENEFCFLEDADETVIGKTAFLAITPGHITLTPPNSAGQLIQPLGTITKVISGTLVAVLIRYEYRVKNA